MGAERALEVLKKRGATVLFLMALAGPSSGQELSADGRSVVGQTTALDVLVRVLDPDRLLMGLSGDQLNNFGEALYPQEGVLHNRAAHRLGSKILTGRFGPGIATALGIANEIFEAYNLRHTGHPVVSTTRFDFGDLAANFRGIYDSYAQDLNSPPGLVRLLGMERPREWEMGLEDWITRSSRVPAGSVDVFSLFVLE